MTRNCKSKRNLLINGVFRRGIKIPYAPYDLEGREQVVEAVMGGDLLRPGGLLIFEHSDKTDVSAYPGFWQLRSYGSVRFSFFKK